MPTLRTQIAIFLVASTFACGQCSQGSNADEPGGPSLPAAAKSLDFRRVYVPEERIGDVIRGEYIPYNSVKFEKLIDELVLAPGESPPTVLATQAVYEARFDEQRTISGTAIVDVRLLASEVATIPFDRCSLAISKPVWDEVPRREARLGGTDEDNPVLYVEQTGRLLFDWSSQGTTQSNGDVLFSLALPKSTSARMVLQLPVGWTPSARNAVIRQTASLDGLREWSLVVEGSNRVALRLSRDAADGDPQVALVRSMNLTYSFDKTLVRLLAEVRFDAEHRPLDQLSILVSAPLRVRAAHLGDAELQFVTSRRSPNEHVVTVAFPQEVQGIDRRLKIDAVLSPVLERDWQLPTMVVLNTQWHEASTSLELVAPISLDRLQLSDCVQTAVKPLRDPPGQTIELRHLTPDAAITVWLGRESYGANYVGGTTIRLSDEELHAATVLDITSTSGSQFEVDLDVPPPWIVDSVKAVMIEERAAIVHEEPVVPLDWNVESPGEIKQILTVSLKRPLRAGRIIRLSLQAHRPRPELNTTLSIEQMQVFMPREIKRTKHLVALYGQSPYRFELQSDKPIQWFDSSQATASERDLISTDPGGWVFVRDNDSQQPRGLLMQSAARYTSSIEVRALVHPESLVETYRVRCTPVQNARIDKVQVALSQPSDQDIAWSLDGESVRAVSSRRFSMEEQQAAGIATSDDQSSIDVWEITLLRPRNVPFTIVGRRRSDVTDMAAVSLAWIPKATSQDGTLVLESDGDTQFDVEQTDLTPFPLASAPAGSYIGERAAFRYRPVKLPVVHIVRCQGNDTPVSAWAWSCHLTSRVSEAQTLHTACYRIECFGLRRISLSLPVNAVLREVRVDGQAINVNSSGKDAAGRIAFSLPVGVRHPTVVVNYTDPQSLNRIVANCKARLPEISIPVLRRQWTLCVPPETICLDSQSSLENALPQDDLASRLLGPLVNRTKRASLDTAAFQSWWTDVVGAGNDHERTRQVLQMLTIARNNADTWSQIMTRYADLVEQKKDQVSLPQLYVDRLSLERLAITPSAALPVSGGGGIEDLLDQAGLAVLMQDERAVIVSQSTLATRRSAIRIIEKTPACHLIDGAELMANVIPMSVGEWLEYDARMPCPWKSPDNAFESELFHAGWTVIEFEIESREQLNVRLVNSSHIRLLAWSAFFLFTGFGWWVSALRLRRLFIPILVSGTAAILVPYYFSMIATACFLGLFAGGAIAVVSGRISLTGSASTLSGVRSEGLSRSAVATTALVLLAICAAVTASAWADDGLAKNEPPTQPKETGKINAVVIPIDKEKRPVGDVVYLPRDFFEALLKLTANRKEDSRAWLIRAANYDFTLYWKGVGSELAPAELNATYHFDVMGNQTEVVLPLTREHLKVLPERAMLNGKSIQVDWESDGNGLIFDAGRVGAHILELSFQPMTRAVGELQSLAFSIPRVPNSHLRVHLPADASDVEIRDSLGAIDRSGDRVVTAQLGPVSQMEIRWPPSGTREGDADRVSASQLSWLRVNQGSVVMQSQFRFSTPGGTLDRVAIKHDPRLQLRLAPDQPVEIVQQASTDGGATRTVYFRPIDRDKTELTLDATFAVAGTSGIGNLPLPRVEAVADETVRNWLAVSLGPGLQLVGEPIRAVEPMESHGFLDQWNYTGLDQIPPDFAYIVTEPRHCQFSVHPRPVDVRAVETLCIGVENDSARLRYRADIEVATGDVFRILVRVPDDLDLEEVTLKSSGRPRRVSWKRMSVGIVTVLAFEPLGQSSTLSLHGKTPVSKRQNLTLPNVAILSIPIADKHLKLYRQASVRLTLPRTRQWRIASPEEQGSLDPELGRLAAVLTPVSQQQIGNLGLPKVSIQSNVPSPSYQLAIVARRIDGQWWAEIDCRLHSFKGLVDTLRLDIPATWTQPFEADGATVNRIDTPGSNRSQLLVQWPSALSDATVVRLRGKLGGQPRELPDIRIADHLASRTDRFVALQEKSVDQKTDWQTDGLRETPWPDSLTQEVPLPAGEFRLFRVAGQRFRAWVGNIGPVAGVPQVRLVDMRVHYSAADYFCITAFDLEPAGLEQCVFQLPPHTRLLHASVAGHPAMTRVLRNQKWAVHLSHHQLPQRIELLYAGPWRSGVDATLPLPQIVNIAVERTLVTLIGNRGHATWQPRGAKIDALQQELFRLRSMTTLIDLSRTMAKDQIPLDKQRWYLPWARWMVASTRTISGYRKGVSTDKTKLDVELSELSSTQMAAAEGLQTIGALKEEMNLAVTRPGLVEAANAARFSAATYDRMIVNGRVRDIALSETSSEATRPWQRFWAVVLFLLVSSLIYFGATQGPLTEWFVHWPFVFGVMSGLFWWLFLQPSVAGWLIVIASVIATLRSHGNRVALRQRKHQSA